MNASFPLIIAFLYIAVWGFALLAAAAIYVFRSLGLYTMAKNTAMPNPWLAWIPVAHDYLAGKMADRFTATQGKKTRYAFWNLLWMGLTAALYVVFVVVLFLWLFGTVFARQSWRGYHYDSFFAAPGMGMAVVLVVAYVLLLAAAVTAVVFRCISHYHLYGDFEPDQRALHTVLTVFGLDCVSKMMLRNNVPVGVAGRRPGGQPKYK